MKLATVEAPDGTGPRVAVVADDLVHPLPADLTMRDVVAGGLEQARQHADDARTGDAWSLATVQLLAPLQPTTIRDFVAFHEHVEGVRGAVSGGAGVPDAWYDAPTFYFANPHTVHGPGATAKFPMACESRDLELEVAAVVGKGGRSLNASSARDHIFGYTILNDWSARDLQDREMKVGLGPAKGKDFGNALGPWIVTVDELEPHRDEDGFLSLACSVTVNGDDIGWDLLSNMSWTFETLLAYASRDSWVEPGDLLASGTVGRGCLAELRRRDVDEAPPYLAPGDVVTLTVEGIGSLTNVVGVAAAVPALSPPRLRDSAAARSDRP